MPQKSQYIPLAPANGDCPVERLLPPELLLLIFVLGVEEEKVEDALDEPTIEDDDGDDEYEDGEEEKDEDAPDEPIIEDDDGDDEYEDVDSNESSNEGANVMDVDTKRCRARSLPIQVSVSQVCRRWRNVAIGAPKLWTDLDFTRYKVDMLEEFTKRSAQCNLSITIDHSPPKINDIADELDNIYRWEDRLDLTGSQISHFAKSLIAESKASLSRILGLIFPQINRWQDFFFNTNLDIFLSMVLDGLTTATGGAPELKRLELHLFDPSYVVRRIGGDISILNGNAPKLCVLSTSEICIDLDLLIPPSERSLPWDPTRIPSQTSNLTTLDLSYTQQISNSQLTYEKFAHVLRCAPGLQSLSLEDGGPLIHIGATVEPLFLRNLRELALRSLSEDYVQSILPLFYAPGLLKLVLDFDEDGGDYVAFVNMLVAPMAFPPHLPADFSNPIYLSELDRNIIPTQVRSLVANLTDLKLVGLPTPSHAVKELYKACPFVRRLHTNMYFLDYDCAKSLGSGAGEMPFRMLEEWTVSGLDPKAIFRIVNNRKRCKLGLKRLRIDEDTEISSSQLQKLKGVVQYVDLVELSDDETEVEVDDDDDDDDDDEDDEEDDEDDEDDDEEDDVGEDDEDPNWESVSDDDSSESDED